MNTSKSTHLIIFTDLDGTLLDHETYSFSKALPALQEIKGRGIPLILNSSKTFAEMEVIQQLLEIRHPMICENGAAIYLPRDNESSSNGWQREAFSKSREYVLDVLRHLREKSGYKFSGFSDYSLKKISELTGLSNEQSVRASMREFSEPLLWQGNDASLQDFICDLKSEQLFVQQGGRFLSVASEGNKVTAMETLINHYQQENTVTCVALGDSPNDEAMLNQADIAVVIQSARSKDLQVSGPQQLIRTQAPGPEGWQWAMDKILSQYL